jgi:hypothetical protein
VVFDYNHIVFCLYVCAFHLNHSFPGSARYDGGSLPRRLGWWAVYRRAQDVGLLI